MSLPEAAEASGLTEGQLLRVFDSLDAMTYRQQQGDRCRYLVIYRTDGRPDTRQLALAHELGHRVLGHRLSGDQEEQAADLFASHLLCPRPLVQYFLNQGYTQDGQLADLFYVPESCIRLIRSEKWPQYSPQEAKAAAARFHYSTLRADLQPVRFRGKEG